MALRAGVGIATVDLVLNERGNVSQGTAARVLAAARELDLRRILPDRHRRTLRIEVLLARPDTPLIARIGEEFGALMKRIDRSVVIHRSHLKSEDPEALAGRITLFVPENIPADSSPARRTRPKEMHPTCRN